jgi:hypothetical protein
MNAQIRAKTMNRGRDWAIFHRPDEKRAAGGLIGFMAGDALSFPFPARDGILLEHASLPARGRGFLSLLPT